MLTLVTALGFVSTWAVMWCGRSSALRHVRKANLTIDEKATARVFAMVPRAAELYRQQVQDGLDGNPREALKAKVFLRGLFVDGKIVMSPGADGSLWALYSMQPAGLLKAAGTGGRGDWI